MIVIMILLFIGALTIGIISALASRVFRHDNKNTDTSPPAAPPRTTVVPPQRYEKNLRLLSHAEQEFHRALLLAVPEAPIFPKVRVADVISAKQRFSGDFLRISQKHFDWVLCDPRTFEPLVAIELDDSSHRYVAQQVKNDAVKNTVCREANLALVRFPWSSHYDPDGLRNRLAAVVNSL